MRKKTFADKLAEKQFNSKEIQKSWQMHEAAFGPILTPAFKDDYQAKVHVCAILNLISNRKLQEALKKIEHIKKFVETDEDKALYLFMMAIIFEFAGMEEQMIACYSECNSYNHHFYMPYVKVAKHAQNTCLDASIDAYEKAIECLNEQNITNQAIKSILASTYTNYANALIMQHKYEKAKEMLDKSIEIVDNLPNRQAILAVYYAAVNNRDLAIDTVNQLENHELFVHTKQVVTDILEGKHFQFNEMDIDYEAIKEFWAWFSENESKLRTMLSEHQNEEVINQINDHLLGIFPLLKKDIEFGIMINKDVYQLEFCDNYAIGLVKGFEKMIESSPKLDNWTFKITH